MEKKVTPRPAVVTGNGPYNVDQLLPGMGGFVDRGHHIIGVPTDTADKSYAIRAHELAHLVVHEKGYFDHNKFRDELVAAGVKDFSWYNAVLDLVVNTYCVIKGAAEILDLDAGVGDLDKVSDKEFVQLYLRLQHTKKGFSSSVLNSRVGDYVQVISDRLVSEISGMEFRGSEDRYIPKIVKYTVQLAQLFEMVESEEEKSRERLSSLCALPPTEKLGREVTKRAGSSFIYDEPSVKDYIPAGKMEIKTHHLSRRMVVRTGQGVSSRPFGSVPNRTWRMPPLGDGKIFAMGKAANRNKGGTLVIDASGSMSIQYEQLLEILEHKPLSTITIYSGAGNKGVMHILAKDGRLVAESIVENDVYNRLLGGNVIDLPALEWLSKQPQPRVWICDGVVTGVGDMPSRKMTEMCTEIVRRNKITQRLSIAHYLEQGV